ncbi:hypothetical protein KUTeg_004470 [Tegillarca granosa]|uniref:Transmembrane protein 180 n=1 Tax=Tegillarca granosa TaxID=220873 RepID=A0ABQ9FQ12_TEGGR|nr:hypothetical protein KUTeg_004470 [Tegillarca granosa]
MVSLNRRILAFSTCTMAFSSVSAVFHFYYVRVFLNRFHIEEKWFHTAQVLFLIWNAINDPLFAYIQDNVSLPFTRSRREAILYSAPLFSMAFLVPWFSWEGGAVTTGMHLIVSLCFWDTIFTYIGLAECCLFTEISKRAEDRLKLVRFSQLGSLIGSSSVLILEHISDSLESYTLFQVSCACLALFSWMLMTFTGYNAYTEYDLKNMNDAHGESINCDNEGRQSNEPWFKLLRQLFTKDFCLFIVTNFLQEFHRTFLANFIVIICDQLVSSDVVSPHVRRTFYGAVSMAPKTLVVFCAPLVGRIGYFRAIRYNFIWKILGGMSMFLIGNNHPWCLMIFLILDSCFCNATFSLFNMPLSDIADRDMEKHNRKHPLSSMVFGTQACFVKPTISLSPMLVVSILNHYGYTQLKNGDVLSVDLNQLKHAIFLLVCVYPVCIGALQLCVWSGFSIRKETTMTIPN